MTEMVLLNTCYIQQIKHLPMGWTAELMCGKTLLASIYSEDFCGSFSYTAHTPNWDQIHRALDRQAQIILPSIHRPLDLLCAIAAERQPLTEATGDTHHAL